MNFANRLTILRILVVPFFIGSLLYYSPERIFLHRITVVMFLMACLSDALDGYLARKLNQCTVFGSYIDPIADKLLLLGGFLSLSLLTNLPAAMKIPAWVTIAVISRDMLIMLGSGLILLMTGTLKAAPLFVSKLTTFAQMLTLFFSLIKAPEPMRFSFFCLATALTVISGIEYIRMGSRILQQGEAARP